MKSTLSLTTFLLLLFSGSLLTEASAAFPLSPPFPEPVVQPMIRPAVQPASARVAGPVVRSAFASGPQSDQSAGRAVLDNTIGIARTQQGEFGPLLHIDGIFGDGQGWGGDLFRAQAFIPWHLNPGRSLFFLSLMGTANDSGNGMGSFGGGFSSYNPKTNRVWSFAGSLDIDDGHSRTYKRITASFQSLGKHIDFMANGYAILGSDSNVVRSGLTGAPATFSGNNVLYDRSRTTEHAYSGIDFWVGGPLPMLGHSGTRVYVGGHWLTTPGRKDAFGTGIRITQQINDDVNVSVHHSYDPEFGRNTMVQVGMTLPTGKRKGWMKSWFRQRPVQERLADRIYKNPRISVKTHTDILSPIVALDPRDGLPLRIYYVDGAGAAGTGTVESPGNSLTAFNALPLATRNGFDIVYVRGTAFGMNGTMTVGPGQRLLSTMMTQTATTHLGGVTLPWAATGIAPILTNTLGGNVLALSNGSEISGFDVNGGGTGRPINGTGIMGFNINNNILRNSVDHGLALLNVNGTVAAGTNGIISNNTVIGNPNDGIQLINNLGGGTLDLLMSSNITSNNGTAVGGVGIRIEAHNGDVINADASAIAGTGFTGNSSNSNGTGMRLLTTSGGVINASLSQNTFNNNADPTSGLSISATGVGSIVNIASMTNNIISSNTGLGIYGTTTGGGSIVINNMFGNIVDGNNAGNLRLEALTAGSTINANIGVVGAAANTFSGSTIGAGIELISLNGTMFASIQNNIIGTAASPNATSGILGTIDGGITGIVIGGGTAGAGNIIQSNGVATNTGVNLVFSNTAGVLFSPQVLSGFNVINGIGGRGMAITNQSAMTHLTFTSSSDTMTNNGSTTIAGGGLAITNNAPDSTGQINSFVSAGFFNNNAGGDGIRLTSNAGSTLLSTISASQMMGNGSGGNPGNGVRFNINGTSNGSLTLLSSTIQNNTNDGVLVAVNAADALGATANSVIIGTAGAGNTISGNGGDGIELSQNSTGKFTSVSVAHNVITGSTGNGIFYNSLMTSAVATPFIGVFTNNSVQGNTLAGFSADIRGFFGTRGALGAITLASNNFSANTGSGISFVTDTDLATTTVVGTNAITINHGGGAVIAHDPNSAAFGAQLPAGSFKPSPDGRYLHTLTDINLAAVVTGNTLVANGGDGASIAVGTGTYVRLDFQSNRAENNTGVGYRASSFLSAGATPITTNAGGIDTLTLDNTAQLDMRFLHNRLDTISVGAVNAFQTNVDAGKAFAGPNPWTFAGDSATNRPVFFYRVDNAASLDSTNVIINGGIPTITSAAFGAGRFNVDAGSVFGSAAFANDQPLP